MLQHVTEESPRRVRRGVLLLVSLVGAAITVPWTIVSAQNPVQTGPGDAATAAGQITSPAPLARNAATLDLALKKGSTAVAVGLDKKVSAFVKGKQAIPGSAKSLNADPKNTGHRSVAARGMSDPKTVIEGGNLGLTYAIPAPKNPAFTTRIFRLQYASAETLAKNLSTLYDEEVGKTFKLVPDLRTKSIVLRANPEKMEEIGRLIRELDNADATVDSSGAPNVKIIPLMYIQAGEIAQTLTKLFADHAPSDVKIIPVERTNSLIVQASQDKFEEIVNILRKVDISK
jgi:type II secretory pathway component GspD/PulD (secretin)